MTRQPEPGQTKTQYSAHVELFQEFFGSRGQHCGDALDVVSLAQRLASPGAFYDDMSALVRTVLYRESLQISRAELLDLICIAVGGSQAELTDPRLEQAKGQLLLFVNVVLLSLKKRPFESDIDRPDSAVPHSDEPLLESPPLDGGSTITRREMQPERGTPTETDEPYIPQEAQAGLPEPGLEELPSATAPIADMQDPISRNTAYVPAPMDDLRLPPLAPAPRVRRPPSRTLLSRPAAVVAAFALLCVAAVIFWPRSKPVQRQPTPNPDRKGTQAAVPSASDKPSPYGGSDLARAGRSDAEVGGHDQAVPSVPAQTGENSAVGAVPAAGEATSGESTPAAADTESPAMSPAPYSSRGVESPARDSGQPVMTRKGISVQHGGRKALYTVSSGVMSSNLISAPPPEYPVLAKLTRVEGQVIMQAVVSRNGRVIATHVLQGHHLLRGAAEHAVRSWRYRPYVINGRPTDVETVVFVEFRLHH